MNYRELYSDLAEMERRAISAATQFELDGNQSQAFRCDLFLREIQEFMDVVALRRW